jgi:hypothetical protein
MASKYNFMRSFALSIFIHSVISDPTKHSSTMNSAHFRLRPASPQIEGRRHHLNSAGLDALLGFLSAKANAVDGDGRTE